MVNLSLYPELKDVDPSLIDDDVIAQAEAQRAATKRASGTINIIPEIYREFEKENLDTIAFLADDIGVMMKVRERFRRNQRIREFCEYFIRIDHADMEKISEEIENDRRTLKEIENV